MGLKTKIKKLKQLIGRDIDLLEMLRGSFKSFGVKILGIASSFILTWLTTHLYGKEAFGITMLVFVVLRAANIFSRLGLDIASMRLIAQYSHLPDKKELVVQIYSRAVLLVALSSFLVSLLLYNLADFIANTVFQREYMAEYIRWLSFVVTPMSISFLNAECLRGIKKIATYSFFYTTSVYLFSVVILLSFQFYSRESWIPVMVQNIAIILSFLGSALAWFLSGGGISLNSTAGTVSYQKMLAIGRPLMMAAGVMFILNWSPTLILGMYKSDGEIGIYNAVIRVAALLNITLLAINSISAPKFAEMYGKNDMTNLQKVVSQSTLLIFWSTLPLLLIIVLFPGQILGVFGDSFDQGATALRYLAIGQFVNALCGSVGYILQMTGFQKVFQNIVFMSAFLNVGLTLWLVPILGINGAAIAGMCSTIFWNIGGAFFVKKKLNILTFYFPLFPTEKQTKD